MKKKSLNAKKVHNKLLNYLKNPKINKLYKVFENSLIIDGFKIQRITVAVSGGPDSLALSYLAKCHSIINNSKVKYFHVDHKLRRNSTKEALKLKNELKKFDIECEVLPWKGNKPKSNIQSVARENRYKLIEKKILNKKFNNILIAHHLDDLYENFIIRLTRGSGLRGLVSFNKQTTKYSKKISILRPLIGQNKNNLIFLANKVFKGYLIDPSNKNTTFTRVRVRNLLDNLKKEGLDEKKFKQTIINLSDADISINYYVKKNIKSNSNYLKNKSGYILRHNFFEQPHEIVFRSFSDLLKKIGDKYYASRGKSINRLIYQIQLKKFQKATLSGCIIEKINNSLIIYKEITKKRKYCSN